MESLRRTPSSKPNKSIDHDHLDQTITVSVPGLRIRNMLINQPLKTSPVVVMAEVGEFMGDNIVDAITWCFDQVWIQDDMSIGGAASPLA